MKLKSKRIDILDLKTFFLFIFFIFPLFFNILYSPSSSKKLDLPKNFLLINDKPFFPVGWWVGYLDDPLEVKAEGINTVLLYTRNVSFWEIEQYLKKALKYDLKVIFGLDGDATHNLPLTAIDDKLPNSASYSGAWIWKGTDGIYAYSGDKAHGYPHNENFTYLHGFYDPNLNWEVPKGEDIYIDQYVYVPRSEKVKCLKLTFYTTKKESVSAYWGKPSTRRYTANNVSIGEVPEQERWSKLSVQARQLGLDGKKIYGIDFESIGGRVWWDRTALSGKILFDEQKIKSLVEEFESYPNIIAWMLIDEPEYPFSHPRGIPEKVKRIKHIVNKRSNKPTMVNFAHAEYLGGEYSGCYDIFSFDRYIVRNDDNLPDDILVQDLQNAKKGLSKENENSTIIVTLQAFGTNSPFTKYYKSPTYKMQRYMFYTSLINGAEGILFWVYYYASRHPQIIKNVNRIVREFNQIKPIVFAEPLDLSVKISYQDKVASSNATSHIFREVNNKYFFLCANNSSKELKVNFKIVLDKQFSSASLIKDKRTIKTIEILSNSFSDTLPEFGIHVYELM